METVAFYLMWFVLVMNIIVLLGVVHAIKRAIQHIEVLIAEITAIKRTELRKSEEE